jgi:hypothetical protein
MHRAGHPGEWNTRCVVVRARVRAPCPALLVLASQRTSSPMRGVPGGRSERPPLGGWDAPTALVAPPLHRSGPCSALGGVRVRVNTLPGSSWRCERHRAPRSGGPTVASATGVHKSGVRPPLEGRPSARWAFVCYPHTPQEAGPQSPADLHPYLFLDGGPQARLSAPEPPAWRPGLGPWCAPAGARVAHPAPRPPKGADPDRTSSTR